MTTRQAIAFVLTAAAAGLFSGCSEFSHFGQINNRETSRSVNDVTIEQQQEEGGWKEIGRTDGKGAWNIFKMQIKPGRRIRLSKPGYESLVLEESDFLSQSVILLTPSGEMEPGGDYLQQFGN